VIWIDADVLVCAPARLVLEGVRRLRVLRRDLARSRRPRRAAHAQRRINNAVMVMDVGQPDPRLLHPRLPRPTPRTWRPATIAKLAFGPQLLVRLAQVAPLPVIGVRRHDEPRARARAGGGGGAACAAYGAARGGAIGAINLCASLVGVDGGDRYGHRHGRDGVPGRDRRRRDQPARPAVVTPGQ
jgi:hypothetical protein